MNAVGKAGLFVRALFPVAKSREREILEGIVKKIDAHGREYGENHAAIKAL